MSGWKPKIRGSSFSSWLDRPLLVGAVLFGVTFLGAALVASFGPWPEPRIHDEFGYLLLGDTFASGRLTNPTHPFWHFFETFHVFHEPTYTAKYPPAQGVVLAIGQAATGRPIVGVWLSAAIMVAAVYWALLQWTHERLAALGAGLLLLQVGIVGYWAQSFWGGAVAAAAGALAIGAARGLADRPGPSLGILLGIGLSILANSRPLEGLILTLALGGYVGWRWWREPKSRGLRFRALSPAVAIGVLTLAGMGLYNQRVTGDPLRFPYEVYQEQYGVGAVFVWEEPGDVPDYRHEAMKEFYRSYGVERHRRVRSGAGFLRSSFIKIYRLLEQVIGAGVLGLLAILLLPGDRDLRFASGVVGLTLIVLLATMGGWPHYFAPATAFLYLLIGEGLGRIRDSRWLANAGDKVFFGLLLVFPLLFLVRVQARISSDRAPFVEARQHIRTCLLAADGDDLVFVDYQSDHVAHVDFDWVYNDADIDGSEIVWARQMSRSKNAELRAYYPERRSWTLRVGSNNRATLVSYQSGETNCTFENEQS